tara:strand:+ start:27 stop:917 length:891 start_codon:yes stop_codon:yes gene_type:complete
MAFQDILLTFLIFLIFGTLIIYNIVMIKIRDVTQNWKKYRCQPAYMPWASIFGYNAKANFDNCVKEEQKKNMDKFLEPVNNTLSSIERGTSGNNETISTIKSFLNDMRTQLEKNIKRVFTVFLGTIMPIQHILIRFRDLTMKMVASMAVLLYMGDGTNKTLISAWNSDAGGVLRTMCFHPETLIDMSDGSLEYIKNVKVGDRLKHGVPVLGTLILKGNDENNPFYMLYSKETKSYIYVTGSHMIYNEEKGKFIKVDNPATGAFPTDKRASNMYCLITDNHLIYAGEYIFWDWEDGN